MRLNQRARCQTIRFSLNKLRWPPRTSSLSLLKRWMSCGKISGRRRTLSFSKSLEMLEAALTLYFHRYNASS